MNIPQPCLRQRLQVVADVDCSAIARVLDPLQNLNITPRRVVAEISANDILRIEVDVCGLSEEHLSMIVRKIRRSPCIVEASWDLLD